MQTKKVLWTGRVMSLAAGGFLLFDSVIHMLAPAQVTEGFAQMGFSPAIAFPLGVVELVCLILYAIPQTSILGAMLLTGYLGGAVATNVRMGAPFFSLVLAPVYIAIVMWGGLYGREPRLRTLVPWKKD